MDPDANLDEQLAIAKRFEEGKEELHDDGRLAELVLAMDHWITGGGFLPARWKDVTRGR